MNMPNRQSRGWEFVLGSSGRRGWTLDELAERTGLSKAYLSRLEAGDRQPSIARLLTLAKAYNVSIASLFELPEAQEPCVIVSRNSHVPLRNGLKYIPLTTGNTPFNLQPIAVTVEAIVRIRSAISTRVKNGLPWFPAGFG